MTDLTFDDIFNGPIVVHYDDYYYYFSEAIATASQLRIS